MRTPRNDRLSADIADAPPAPGDDPGPQRRCVLTNESGPRAALVRLAIAPDGMVLPDAQERAPGRGAWVTASRRMVEDGIASGRLKAGLARSHRTGALVVPDDLADRIEAALARVLLDRLGLELRVGTLVLGTQRLIDQARAGGIALLLHAADASADGQRKLDQAWRVGQGREGSGERGRTLPLDRDALSVALGRDNVVHLGLADRRAADRVTGPLMRYSHYLGHSEAGDAIAGHGPGDDTNDTTKRNEQE